MSHKYMGESNKGILVATLQNLPLIQVLPLHAKPLVQPITTKQKQIKRKNTGQSEMNTSKHKSKKCAKENEFDISTLMMYATEVRTDFYYNSASCRSFPQYNAMNINLGQPSYHCRSAITETIETFVKHHNEDDFIK